MRKHATKKFRLKTHDTFDSISKSYPNGMFIQQFNFSDSPVGSHDVSALICAIPIEAIATSSERNSLEQTGDLIPSRLVKIIRNSKLTRHKTETMRCIPLCFWMVVQLSIHNSSRLFQSGLRHQPVLVQIRNREAQIVITPHQLAVLDAKRRKAYGV